MCHFPPVSLGPQRIRSTRSLPLCPLPSRQPIPPFFDRIPSHQPSHSSCSLSHPVPPSSSRPPSCHIRRESFSNRTSSFDQWQRNAFEWELENVVQIGNVGVVGRSEEGYQRQSEEFGSGREIAQGFDGFDRVD